MVKRCFKKSAKTTARAARFSKIEKQRRNEATSNISVGDILIGQIPHHDGSNPKSRPLLVWGINYDFNDEVSGFDVFGLTTQLKSFPGILALKNEDFILTCEQKSKDAILCSSQLITIPAELADLKKGTVRKLKHNILPDIIARRAFSLKVDSEHNEYRALINFDNISKRNGFSFDDIHLNDIDHAHRSPEINGFSEKFDLQNQHPDHTNISQDDVNAIARWAISHAQQFDNIHRIEWPETGTWPNWPDIEIDGKIIKCCVDETNLQRSVKKTHPNAAAKRAMEFAKFTF